MLAGGATPPGPAVPGSTRISARMKCVQEHSSPINMSVAGMAAVREDWDAGEFKHKCASSCHLIPP